MIGVVWSCDGFGQLTWLRVLYGLDANVKQDFTFWTILRGCRLDREKTFFVCVGTEHSYEVSWY